MTNEIPQCIHIPDGSVVVSGELFDMACAAIAERDKLIAEVERIDKKCGALAYLQYGSSGPDDPWQAKLDEVTKPLHVEIESLRKALDNRGRQLGIQPTVHEPCEQLPPELAWGLESKLPGESWKVYWSLYSDRARAEQAAKNGRPEGTEWRVVTYARMPEGASRDASSTCNHDLATSNPTVIVDGKYDARCYVCKEEWHIPHPKKS